MIPGTKLEINARTLYSTKTKRETWQTRRGHAATTDFSQHRPRVIQRQTLRYRMQYVHDMPCDTLGGFETINKNNVALAFICRVRLGLKSNPLLPVGASAEIQCLFRRLFLDNLLVDSRVHDVHVFPDLYAWHAVDYILLRSMIVCVSSH